MASETKPTADRPSLEELRAGPVTLRIWPDAARALGIGRANAYRLAAEGEIPTIKLGKRRVVPTAALLKMIRDVEDDQ